MPFLKHQYGQTYYQYRGSKRSGGTPIICLHGGPGGHSRFMHPLFELSDERQVYLYDQTGGGRSSPTEKKHWRIPVFVNEFRQLLDHWEIDQFHLFGASWGTTLALEIYLRRDLGKRIQSLTFQSPMFSAADWTADANRLIKGLPAKERKVINYCHEIGATDAEVYREAMKVYYAKHVLRSKAKAKKRGEVKNDHGHQVYEHMWGASEFSATGTLRGYDRVNDLPSITCPTLFICGEHDEAQPRTAKRYKRMIKGARFEEIGNASHAILTERPKPLIRAIRSFLSDLD